MFAHRSRCIRNCKEPGRKTLRNIGSSGPAQSTMVQSMIVTLTGTWIVRTTTTTEQSMIAVYRKQKSRKKERSMTGNLHKRELGQCMRVQSTIAAFRKPEQSTIVRFHKLTMGQSKKA